MARYGRREVDMWALWALSAWGDEPTGSIRVTVVAEELELPVAGARVQLGAVEVVADEGGAALFVGLPEGRYEASASADGHRGAVVTGIPVHVNRVTPLTICMNAGAGEPPAARSAPHGSARRRRSESS